MSKCCVHRIMLALHNNQVHRLDIIILICCFCSVVQSCPTLCCHVDCSTQRFLVLHHLLGLVQTHVHWVVDTIQLSCPLLLLPSIFPSIRVFSNESVLCIRWPKYRSFNISPSNEYSGLISFRIDWFDLPAVQGALKSLLQHHSSKASVLRCSAFFMVQLSHPYMTTGKSHSFDYMDLCWQSNVFAFNMLSRLVIAFLPRSKCLLISWLQSPSDDKETFQKLAFKLTQPEKMLAVENKGGSWRSYRWHILEKYENEEV